MSEKKETNNTELIKLIETLSPNERKVLEQINSETIEEISESSGLDEISVLRSLEYLQNKEIIKLKKSSSS